MFRPPRQRTSQNGTTYYQSSCIREFEAPAFNDFDALCRAFAVAPAGESAIAGQQVLLVDDVMTTGATLDALARLLLRHGATAVDAVVFARTAAPGE